MCGGVDFCKTTLKTLRERLALSVPLPVEGLDRPEPTREVICTCGVSGGVHTGPMTGRGGCARRSSITGPEIPAPEENYRGSSLIRHGPPP